MATRVVPRKGTRDKIKLSKENESLTIKDLEEFLQSSVILYQMLSDDVLVVRVDHREYENLQPNNLGSLYLGRPVYGRCMILDKEEVTDLLRPLVISRIAQKCEPPGYDGRSDWRRKPRFTWENR